MFPSLQTRVIKAFDWESMAGLSTLRREEKSCCTQVLACIDYMLFGLYQGAQSLAHELRLAIAFGPRSSPSVRKFGRGAAAINPRASPGLLLPA